MTSLEDLEKLTDAELVTYARLGNAVAFAGLIDRHRTRIERMLRALLSHQAEIEDIWQETLLRAFLNLDSLREEEHFRAWICTIALNLARSHRKREAARLRWLDSLQATAAAQAPSLEEHTVQHENTERIRAAIAALPPAERDAIMLVYLGDLSHKEAANQLGATLSAVKVRVHRGRKRLHSALVDEFGTQPIPTEMEPQMIQVTIHDIVLQTKKLGNNGKINESALDLLQLNLGHRIIVLKETEGNRMIPIWVGPHEGDSIAMQLKKTETKRPLSYDLTKTLLDFAQVNVDRVVISRLHDTTFYSNVIVRAGDKAGEIDARPSDAINLALRLDVPIYVSQELMDDIGKVEAEFTDDEDVERQSILDQDSSFWDNNTRYRDMLRALGWELEE